MRQAKTKLRTAQQDSLLWRLQSAFDEYPTALVRAAQYILENPKKVIHQALSELIRIQRRDRRASCGCARSRASTGSPSSSNCPLRGVVGREFLSRHKQAVHDDRRRALRLQKQQRPRQARQLLILWPLPKISRTVFRLLTASSFGQPCERWCENTTGMPSNADRPKVI